MDLFADRPGVCSLAFAVAAYLRLGEPEQNWYRQLFSGTLFPFFSSKNGLPQKGFLFSRVTEQLGIFPFARRYKLTRFIGQGIAQGLL